MMVMSLWHVVFLLGLGSLVAGQTCGSNLDCHLTTSCQLSDGQCIGVSCESDADCPGQNRRCAENEYCNCTQGFFVRNSQCIKEGPRNCTSDRDCDVLHTCNLTATECMPVPCEIDSHCSHGSEQNTRCGDNMYCNCTQGFSIHNGKCTNDFGRVCVTDTDCGSTGVCDNGICQCHALRGFYIHAGVCKHVSQINCTTNVDCDVLHTCNTTIADCLPVPCNSDGDCSGNNTRCADNYCNCTLGFSLRKGQCTNDLGRVCVHTSDCGAITLCYNRAVCKCNTNRGFYQDTGICKQVLDTNCTSYSDCQKSRMRGVVCSNGTCDCDASYTLRSSSDYCYYIIYTSCTNNSGCPMEHAECRSNNNNNANCRCVLGTYIHKNDKTSCRNSIENSCLGDGCSLKYYFNNSYYQTLCDSEYLCSCPDHYSQGRNTSQCIPVFGTTCNTTSDCGNSAMYQCTSGNCTCSESSLIAEQTYYSYAGQSTPGTSVNKSKCISAIGQTCQQNICEAANGICNQFNICECKLGTILRDGICVTVLGLPCQHDVWCAFLNNTRCGASGQCQCKEGYRRNGTECVRVLGSSCKKADDCMLKHSTCGIGNVCECESSYPQFEDRCLVNACHVTVPVLPDIYRRVHGYAVGKTHRNEHLIQDRNMVQRWYSIGLHTLSSSANAPAIGSCGTYYPIYLKGPLTEQQKLTMESSEIVVTATVGGIETELGLTEDIEVKLRKCGDETLVYLKAPQTGIAAYCLDSSRANTPPNYVRYYRPSVRAYLGFYEDTINGTLMDVPYNYYECDYRSSDNLQGSTGVAFAINWYINENHIATYGPTLSFISPASARLTDMVILEHGYKLGFTVKCSIQRASTFTGQLFYPLFSLAQRTGVYDFATLIYIQSTTNSTFQSSSVLNPLGCMTPVGNASLNCTMKFDVVDSTGNATCAVNDTDRHPECGVSIIGLTKRGLGRYGDYKHYGSLIQIEKNLNDSSTLVVKLQHSGRPTGHTIWDEYKYPDIKIKTSDQWKSSNGFLNRCSVGQGGNIYTYYDGESLRFYSLGRNTEYILLRSTTHPVEVQIKTGRSTGVCAVTIRNGNSIDTVNYCNTAPKIGNLYGSGTFDSRLTSYQLLNDVWIYLQYDNDRIDNVRVYGEFNDTEGVCRLGGGRYFWRDGILGNSDSGFVNSWKVAEKESLLNPDNHISYAWNESFYLCHCPKSTDDVPNRWNTQYYTGHLQCNTDYKCNTSQSGEVWRSSLLPPYAIVKAVVSVDLVYKEQNPQLQLKCNFNAAHGYLYTIEWTMNGVSVLRSGYLPASETDTFYLTDDYLIANTDIEFFLDIPIVCSAVVHASNKTQLLAAMYSDPFYPIEIVDTEIDLIRGREAVITVKQNLPFGCSPGPDCRLIYKLIDPDDSYKCKDSTVAVKDRAMCGKEIKGAMSQQEVSMAGDRIDIVITTKNNNKYSLRTVFNMTLVISFLGNGKAIYEGEFQQNLTVSVLDGGPTWHYRFCFSNHDPRMGSFDQVYFSMQLVGTFIMYRHKTLQLEVQMMTQPCNGGWASCSCGLIVRAGRDVYIINHCYGHHITGYLLDDDKILIVRRRSITRYQIYMPQGTMIDVYVSPRRWYMVNINIYPSPTDLGQVYGLCGDFNGERTDDLRHRDGTVTPVYRNRWYYNPDTFSSSWRIDPSSDESLFNITNNRDSLPSWRVDEQMCVCPDDGETVLCSANEEETCVEPVNTRGEKVARKTRVQRSTDSERNYHYERRLESMHKRSVAAKIVKRSTTQSTNISVENAIEICRDAMEAGCALFKMKDDTPSADPEEIVRNCGRDLAINPSIDWSGESCARFQAEVDTQLERDVVFQESKPEAVANITAQNCINNCYNHGTCVNETCICLPGFATDDCSLELEQPPDIDFSPEICNPRTDTNCDCFLIVTEGHVDNPTCRISTYAAETDGAFIETDVEVSPAEYENYNEMFCCVTTSRRKRSEQDDAADSMSAREKRSTDSDDVTRDKRSTGSSDVILGTRFYITVSNNGVNFSTGVYIDVLDPTCQEYVTTTNGDTVALLKTGYCFINGDCIEESAVNPEVSCERCDTRKATYAWTDDECSTGNGASSDDGLGVTYIVLITLGTVIALAMVISLVVFLYYKSQRVGVQPNPSGPQSMDNYAYGFNRTTVFVLEAKKDKSQCPNELD